MGRLQEVLAEFDRLDVELRRQPGLLTEGSDPPSSAPFRDLALSPTLIPGALPKSGGNGVTSMREIDWQCMWDAVLADMETVISTLERLRASMVAAKEAIESLRHHTKE